jgi:hypothetical protein
VSPSKWERHRDLLGTPSYLGAGLVALGPLNNWWWGLPLILVFLVIFRPIYAYAFGESDESKLRRDWGRNLLVVSAQIAFWTLLIWVLYVLHHR